MTDRDPCESVYEHRCEGRKLITDSQFYVTGYDGRLYIHSFNPCCKFDAQVNFCPFCGEEAKKKVKYG